MSDALAMQARLAAPPVAVYHALTDPQALRAWLAEHADVSLAQGRFAFWGRYTPQGEPGRQQLAMAEPDRLLSFTWTLDDQPTKVEIRLEPDAGGAVLRFEQDNLPTLDELMAPTGRRDGRHAMHTFWGLAIANLAEYVDGRPLTPKADFSATRASEIKVELTVAASPDEVFTSLIEPARIGRWFGWPAEVEPRIGGRMTLGVDGKIFEFEPGSGSPTVTTTARSCAGNWPPPTARRT